MAAIMRTAIPSDHSMQMAAPSVSDRGERTPATPRVAEHERLVIGLVNNMSDGAVASTERQFLNLLHAAAGEAAIDLRLFFLPDVPRGQAARRLMRTRYRGIEEVWESSLDGLIVTGAEPRAKSLTEEPYWSTFTRLIDWAQANTISTIWSCLAAHAAVLHLDGIARHPLAQKRFGVFECTPVSPHPLLTDAPPRMRVAHSRWNELAEDTLRACNYTILTRSPQAGIDAFVKQANSLFVFFQGHPEYDGRALLREYRRDIGRFLRRERETYPAIPDGYFDHSGADAMATFRLRATGNRQEHLIDSFPSAFLESRLVPVSKSPATRIYRNWLSCLRDRKAEVGHTDVEPRFHQSQVAEGAS